jgi:photosystem II stability/assembly factor-like uncharacterized protein
VGIDPDPLRDPTVPGQTVRLVMGSLDGILEFNATNQSGTEGVYTFHNEGMILNDDPWLEENQGVYFAAVAFDPRPGKHNIVYAAPGQGWIYPQRPNNDRNYRQIYRSADGGLTWDRIINEEAVANLDAPAYLQVQSPMAVSPNTGKLYVHTWSGMLVYDHEAGEPEFWYGYPVIDSRYADTGAWFNGYVEISSDPWIYSYSLDNYLYIPDNSGWVYPLKHD